MNPRPHAPQPCPEHEAFIRALGGPAKVAAGLQRFGWTFKPQTVSQWIRRGIPFAYRPALVRLARDADESVTVPTSFVDDTALREAAAPSASGS